MCFYFVAKNMAENHNISEKVRGLGANKKYRFVRKKQVSSYSQQGQNTGIFRGILLKRKN